ncbi:MAG: thioredoxin-dependent thiol peroxidase [Rhodospirillaceae bacterium]|nr:thioredoxin-dependent thiol peroxidase [Rhodospirillaceae bacterium]|tara:strand:- start:707 stop:1171 length:465 start_codon:yes stop_codon:yes gene_type:complete
MSIEIGTAAPDFKIQTDAEETLSLKSLKGSRIILYFYPKDDTSGCTKQACAFKEKMNDFKKHNTRIIGLSKDSIKKHIKFKNKYDLNFDLGLDETGSIYDDYGVWKEKSMYGRKYMGIERSTFLINEKGIVLKEWRKVKVNGHIDSVFSAILAL